VPINLDEYPVSSLFQPTCDSTHRQQLSQETLSIREGEYLKGRARGTTNSCVFLAIALTNWQHSVDYRLVLDGGGRKEQKEGLWEGSDKGGRVSQ